MMYFKKIALVSGLVIGGMTVSSVLASASIADTITYDITAYIDGSDELMIQGNTLQWQHFDFAAVGRWGGNNYPTTITSTLNGTVELNNYQWTPDWPNPVPDEIRFPASSSIFTGLSLALPETDNLEVSLDPILSRDSTTIAQIPTASNNYTLGILFNDDSIAGAAFYESVITVSTKGEIVPEPINILGATTSIALFRAVSTALKRRKVSK